MIWFVILVAVYIFAIYKVINTDDKTTQIVVLVAWGLLALAIGHFAWDVFG